LIAISRLACPTWDWCETGGASACRVFSLLFLERRWGVEWILKLAAAGGEGPCVDIMEISKPDHLGDIANLGLTLTEAKQLLARVQREISTAQAREHAVRRPVCPCRDGVCRVKDYRDHAVATLFGQGVLSLEPHHAIFTQPGEGAVNTVAAGTGFVSKASMARRPLAASA
jgi:hypothetical protein